MYHTAYSSGGCGVKKDKHYYKSHTHNMAYDTTGVFKRVVCKVECSSSLFFEKEMISLKK